MAKNYVQDGHAPTFIAPTGGVVSGALVAIGQLVVVPLVTADEGELFASRTGGVWHVPATTGLTAGARVGLLDGAVVAEETEGAIYCGKLITGEADGYADLLLIN